MAGVSTSHLFVSPISHLPPILGANLPPPINPISHHFLKTISLTLPYLSSSDPMAHKAAVFLHHLVRSLATCFTSVHVLFFFYSFLPGCFWATHFPFPCRYPCQSHQAVPVAVFFLSEYTSYPLPSSDLYFFADLL